MGAKELEQREAAQRGADAHAARMVLAAMDTPHGRAAFLSPTATNAEFSAWYKSAEKLNGMTYYEYAIRSYVQRLAVG
jgi:hypothetical protein